MLLIGFIINNGYKLPYAATPQYPSHQCEFSAWQRNDLPGRIIKVQGPDQVTLPVKTQHNPHIVEARVQGIAIQYAMLYLP